MSVLRIGGRGADLSSNDSIHAPAVSRGGARDDYSGHVLDGQKENRQSKKPAGGHSRRPANKILDSATMTKMVQERVWKALKTGYEYSTPHDESDEFLRKNVCAQIEMIVVYVDLVGSTKMTLEMPPERMAIIISSFAQEMAYVIRQYGGYVLKFVGDAVIGYFVVGTDPMSAAKDAVTCAKSMISVIQDGINPILNQYDYPELMAKVGMDAGMGIVVRYGSDARRSHVDLMGPVMNISAKMQDKAESNHVLIGSDVYTKLHPDLKKLCSRVVWKNEEWSFRSRVTNKIYDVYNFG